MIDYSSAKPLCKPLEDTLHVSAASQRRLGLARPLGPVYAAYPHVAAVMVSGSTARGHADRFSDIEVGVFWREPPTMEERERAVRQAGADLVKLYPFDPAEQVWSDAYMLGRKAPDQPRSGIQVDVAHYTVDYMGQVLEDVLQGYDPDLLKQGMIAGIQQAIPLYGAELIQTWQARAGQYPDELREAMVRKYIQIEFLWRWQTWVERGNNLMMLYNQFSQIEQQLVHVLLGLNKQFYFGFKWLEQVLAPMTIIPDRFNERLIQVYLGSPEQGAGILNDLVEDVYNLVEEQLPQIDVASLRNFYRFKRPLW